MIKRIGGTNVKNSVLLYALSTCPWCQKTKALLNGLKIQYDYIDVDLLVGAEQDKIIEEIEAVNPQGGFPTIVINKTKVITGYKPEEIKDELE
jgi:glutaredoxin